MLAGKKITIFGGTGFLGRVVVQKLARLGATIQVITRNPHKALFLKPMGEVGQIKLLPINFFQEGQIQKALKGSEFCINLIGILYEKKNHTFEFIHHQLPKMIAQSCISENISRFIHISALGASASSKARYAMTKEKGEKAIKKAFRQATIFRPSLMFGPDDNFFNRFGALAASSPCILIFGQGKTKFQPIYVGDVADAIVYVLQNSESQGKIYELGGPKIYTFRELIEKILQYTNRHRFILSIPYAWGKMIGSVLQYLPSPILTLDQVKLLQSDSIVSAHAITLAQLGLTPKSLEAIVPLYLKRFKPHF
jgi:uncharacterized protein YbjT (DUF2867 family)